MQSHIQKHLDNFDTTYNWSKRDETPIEPTNVMDSLIEISRKNKDNPLYDETRTLNTVRAVA